MLPCGFRWIQEVGMAVFLESGDNCGFLDNNVPELFVEFKLFNFDRRLVIHGFS